MHTRTNSSAGWDLLGALFVFGFMLAAFGGWVANIVKFAGALSDPLTALEVFRGIGIVCAPIGIVLGFL